MQAAHAAAEAQARERAAQEAARAARVAAEQEAARRAEEQARRVAAERQRAAAEEARRRCGRAALPDTTMDGAYTINPWMIPLDVPKRRMQGRGQAARSHRAAACC